MRGYLHRGLATAVGCALIILLANGAISVLNTRALVAYQHDVVHTQAVLTQLKDLLITLDDAETGQRGYLLTGRPSYLQPYDGASDRVRRSIDHVQALTADNPVQQRQIPALRTLSTEKLSELQSTITLRRQGRLKAALRIVSSDRGQRLMRAIRRVLARMQAEEVRLLNRRSATARASEQRTMATIGIATLANIALLGLVLYLALRTIRRREKTSEMRAQLLAREQAARMKSEQVAAERSAMVQQLADGVLAADAAGHITLVNDAARDILGITDAPTTVADLLQSLQPRTVEGESLPLEQAAFGRALARGETVLNAQECVRRPDGREIIVQQSAAPVIGADGVCSGAVLAFRDVTERHVLERDKDNFLSAAAHDLRTPLATIKGVAQMLQRRVAGDGAALLPGLQRIDATATRMAGLIDEMLDITRLEMGRPLDLSLRPTDLVALVRARIGEARHESTRHTIRLVSGPAELLGTWDHTRLERAIANILSNAIKYSPAGGEIAVRIGCEARPNGTWAVVSVEDHGVGIPEADLPHVLERFRRASNVERIPGTGIGLAAAAQFVEQHGGTIEIASEQGRGTTVTISLPAQLKASPQP